MCVSPFVITDKFGRRQSVPCGKCYECRRAKQQEWCFRLDQEQRSSKIALFITLTYDDENIPYCEGFPSLCKKDVQLYFKRVRKFLEKKSIKYYCVGEYGDKTSRPHYHLLLFYYGDFTRSKLVSGLDQSWHCGFSYILPLQGASGYVTKYVMKMDSRDHLVPPFSLISHGIGKSYLTSAKIQYHKSNFIGYGVKPGGYKVALPRYYKDKIFSTYDKLVLKSICDKERALRNFKMLETMDVIGVSQFWKNRDQAYKIKVYSAKQNYLRSKRL